jgi:septal ring factor EnvC (AmiA/AmiB activator)
LTPPEDRALRERADHLDIAGQNILRLLSRAAWMTEENSKNTLQEVHKLSRELRIAQDRIKELESHLSHYQHRTEHAERWLYQIAAEIERSFFKKNRHPAPMQVVTQSFVRGSQPKG